HQLKEIWVFFNGRRQRFTTTHLFDSLVDRFFDMDVVNRTRGNLEHLQQWYAAGDQSRSRPRKTRHVKLHKQRADGPALHLEPVHNDLAGTAAGPFGRSENQHTEYDNHQPPETDDKI